MLIDYHCGRARSFITLFVIGCNHNDITMYLLLCRSFWLLPYKHLSLHHLFIISWSLTESVLTFRAPFVLQIWKSITPSERVHSDSSSSRRFQVFIFEGNEPRSSSPSLLNLKLCKTFSETLFVIKIKHIRILWKLAPNTGHCFL